MQRKYKIGVMGSARESEDSETGRKAFIIGRQIADNGGILLTGGCPGLPHSAVLGARESGGMTIAISPAMNLLSHSQDFGYPVDSETIIFTGMGNKGRNVILVRSCDACIFVAGGMGTLNEFTIAFDDLSNDNVMGILTGAGGLSDKYMEIIQKTGKTTKATIVSDADPYSLVKNMMDTLARLSAHMNTC